MLDEKIGKIYRHTYAKQPNTPAMLHQKGEYLPQTFRNPCIKDVTDSYIDCQDITVSLTQRPPENSKYVYLSNFNNRNWIPVQWGKIKKGAAVFAKMRKLVKKSYQGQRRTNFTYENGKQVWC